MNTTLGPSADLLGHLAQQMAYTLLWNAAAELARHGYQAHTAPGLTLYLHPPTRTGTRRLACRPHVLDQERLWICEVDLNTAAGTGSDGGWLVPARPEYWDDLRTALQPPGGTA
ncbi:hypothetical protein [Actinomadura hibisca]|uniref:hypothetical protein n=1 Tax=Actinomadura hibisca TaxID=68565 RepID=UPI00082E4E09|nr:hypothetical protein [Actinomadura hibisca]